MEDKIELLLQEFDGQTERQPGSSSEQTPSKEAGEERVGGASQRGLHLDRSFASEYLDELIIAVLYRCDEANGMEIIREFTHRFGVQFSPGTVYPHLHSLEEEGVLSCRESVQTKEYRIEDREAAHECLQSTVLQLSGLSAFLDASARDIEATGENSTRT